MVASISRQVGHVLEHVKFTLSDVNCTETILPTYLSAAQLQSARDANLNLVRAVNRHFDALAQRMRAVECAVLFCDADGWILGIRGHHQLVSELAACGICEGASASEQSMGNNALGISIGMKQPVTLAGWEHFFAPWRDWHCAGAPILSTENGAVVGACCIAVRQPELAKLIGPLVDCAAVGIGNWLEAEEARQDLVRIHHSLISQLECHVVFIDSAGHMLDERHPIPLKESVRSEMVRMTGSGESRRAEEITLDGQVYLVDVRTLSNHRGQMKGTMGLFRDVTQQKQWESHLRDMEKMSTLTSLAAGIAHEIRNPLTAARGFLQLFTERLDSDKDKRFLDLTLHELDRINSLVKDFMALARPEEPRYAIVDMTQAIDDIVHFIQPEAALLGVEFHAQVPAGPIHMSADPNQLKQVLLNVVQNALHACKSKGSVRLSLERQEDTIMISVVDSGSGMSEYQLDRIFQPFFTTKDSGTGLGLSITKRIVEEHGGQIRVDSKVAAGTTVQIEFSLPPSRNEKRTS